MRLVPPLGKICLAHKKGIRHLKTTCIQRAFMRKKQVGTEHDHLLHHCTSNGLYKVFQKTWFCGKCLMRGSSREMAEKTCSRQHWNRTQAKWWIRTPDAYKQKIKVVCNWSEATFQSIQDIAKEIWEQSIPCKSFPPGPQTKERRKKINIQKKAWRQRQNLPEHGTGGKSSGKTAVTELVKIIFNSARTSVLCCDNVCALEYVHTRYYTNVHIHISLSNYSIGEVQNPATLG